MSSIASEGGMASEGVMKDVQLQYCAVDAMLTISKVGREPDMRWTHERETCVMGISVCTAPLADAGG